MSNLGRLLHNNYYIMLMALGVIFLRQILLSPGLENHEGFGWN